MRTKSVSAGAPGIGLRRRGEGGESGRAARYDKIGVPTPDISRSRLQQGRLDDLGYAKGADTVEASRQRPGERGRHMLRHQDRPRKIRGERGEQRLQRRRSARGGAHQHQPFARRGAWGMLGVVATGRPSSRGRAADPVANALRQSQAGADLGARRRPHFRHQFRRQFTDPQRHRACGLGDEIDRPEAQRLQASSRRP